MSSKTTVGELSSRGHDLASGNDTSAIFEVIKNLWHPEDKPDGYISLGVAENDIMHEKLAAYIEKTFTLPHRYLTYNDGGAGSSILTAAIARFLTKHLKPAKPLKGKHIVVTNGCSSAIEGISYNLADPGDGILLGRPYYRSFLPDIEMRPGVKVIPVSFGDIDPFSVDAVACYEQVIQQSQTKNQKIKALMLCHPHNPLGRCYPVETIKSLMKLCQKYRIHLISDEIYALSVWENKEDIHHHPAPTPFISALSIDTKNLIDAHLVHAVWGMSKDFGANGLRIGCMISQSNPALITALQTLSLYTYSSGVADLITSKILTDDNFTDAYLLENQAKLSERFSTAARFLRKHNIPYAPGANAAFFIVADLGSAYRARHGKTVTAEFLMGKLMAKKVFVVDSDAIGSEKPGWFRIVFSQNERYLLEGLRRIVAAIEDGDGDNVDRGSSSATGSVTEPLPIKSKL